MWNPRLSGCSLSPVFQNLSCTIIYLAAAIPSAPQHQLESSPSLVSFCSGSLNLHLNVLLVLPKRITFHCVILNSCVLACSPSVSKSSCSLVHSWNLSAVSPPIMMSSASGRPAYRANLGLICTSLLNRTSPSTEPQEIWPVGSLRVYGPIYCSSLTEVYPPNIDTPILVYFLLTSFSDAVSNLVKRQQMQNHCFKLSGLTLTNFMNRIWTTLAAVLIMAPYARSLQTPVPAPPCARCLQTPVPAPPFPSTSRVIEQLKGWEVLREKGSIFQVMKIGAKVYSLTCGYALLRGILCISCKVGNVKLQPNGVKQDSLLPSNFHKTLNFPIFPNTVAVDRDETWSFSSEKMKW